MESSNAKVKMVETMLFKAFKLCLICTKQHRKARNIGFTGAKYFLSCRTTFDNCKNFLWVFVGLIEFN